MSTSQLFISYMNCEAFLSFILYFEIKSHSSGDHVPTVFDNYTATTVYEGHAIKLGLWDTSGIINVSSPVHSHSFIHLWAIRSVSEWLERCYVDSNVWICSGSSDYDKMRPLSYPGTDCFVLCFALNNPESLTNVKEKVVFDSLSSSFFTLSHSHPTLVFGERVVFADNVLTEC